MDVLDLIKQEKWDEATRKLKVVTQEFRDQDKRENVAASALEEILNSFTSAISKIEHDSIQDSANDLILKYITETFRCLRNVCAGCPKNQTIIIQNRQIFMDTEWVLKKFDNSSADCVILQKCALQFIGNFCVANPQGQALVCDIFMDIFRSLLHSSNNDVVNYVCMVLHNCLLSQQGETTGDPPTFLDFSSDRVSAVILSLLQAVALHDLEWGLYVIEDLLKIPSFLRTLYMRIGDTERLFVVEVGINMLKQTEETSALDKGVVAEENLIFLAKELSEQSVQILSSGMVETDDSQTAYLLVKVIECLGHASSFHSVYARLQRQQLLLVCALNLLRGIHEMGQEGDNHFASVSKVTETDRVDPQHPGYGLKRDLIGLIANMVFKNKDNQDMVREMEGIPLILNQSNIDGRNPFITQWVVLAVRNLCENNNENKAYLHGMKLEGLANNVELLRDFGVQAEISGDKIVVKPPEDQA